MVTRGELLSSVDVPFQLFLGDMRVLVRQAGRYLLPCLSGNDLSHFLTLKCKANVEKNKMKKTFLGFWRSVFEFQLVYLYITTDNLFISLGLGFIYKMIFVNLFGEGIPRLILPSRIPFCIHF